MRRLFSLLALGFTFSLSACGSTMPEPQPDLPPEEVPDELSLSEFFPKSAAAVCARAASCCTPIELESLFLISDPRVKDEASCVAFQGGAFAASLEAAVRQSVESGRAAWDSVIAADCVAAIDAMSCDEYAAHVYMWGQTRSSDDLGCKAITGKVALGGECAGPYECADGFCDGMAPGEMGTCVAKPVAGEPCIGGLCAFGFYCEEGEESVCRALKADGVACKGDAECASNGCSATHDAEGVCEAATTCDDDLSDDEDDVYRACSNVDNPGRGAQCTLRSTGWQCECLVDGEVVSACVPEGAGFDAPVCAEESCCQ